MAAFTNEKKSSRKTLNNSNPDLLTMMANSSHIQLTNRNILNDEKENSMEKNLRFQNLNLRSPLVPTITMNDRKAVLRPALRTLQKQAQPMTTLKQGDNERLLTTPKITKHIRFNLGSGHNDSADTMTPTPPPKEFKRMNSQRKTLRNTRCLSTVVTDRERALVFELDEGLTESPRAPPGFVKSMCKLYSDNFGLRKSSSGTDLNRSNSFSGTTKTQEDLENEGCGESFSTQRRSGSLRLFRSRSWSIRRKKGSESSSSEIENTGPRLSPSYSVKSQDSGFSDSGESGQTKNLTVALQRTRFFTNNDYEDPSDPNLTQIPEDISANPISNRISNSESNGQTLTAKQSVERSLGNIASVTEGLRLKRAFLDEEGQEMIAKSVSLRQKLQGRDNILQRHEVDKVNSKPQIDNLADLSNADLEGAPVFSTPVRASFRRKMLRPKSSVAFGLEDAKTPIKLESKAKLKEMKNRRRWSNIELAELQQEQLHKGEEDTIDASAIFLERSEVPSCIDPSMVAVWSQFMSYEPSLPQLTTNSCDLSQQQPQVSAHLSDTRLSYMAPSLCVDGTSTQLLVQSFNQRATSDLDGHRSLLHYQSMSENGSAYLSPRRDDEETIIEMESKSCSASPDLYIGDFNASREKQSYVKTSPVNEWWRDLHAWCEPECMTYLQSKPILASPRPASSASSISGGRSSTLPSTSPSVSNSSFSSVDFTSPIVDAIKKIQRNSKSVQVTFASLTNHFNSLNLVQMSKTVQVVLTQIQEFIFEYNLGKSDAALSSVRSVSETDQWNFPGLRKPILENRLGSGDRADEEKGLGEILMLQQTTVFQLIDRLKLCTHRCQYTPQQPLSEMKRILVSLQKSFKILVDKMITKEIKPLTREISQPTSEVALRSALHTVIQLGNEGPNSVCALLAREGGVRALLKHCRLPKDLRCCLQTQDLRILSLRALSAICCMADCIRELETCDGLSVIDELLSSRYSSLEDRIESAGLLAQITSPWITDNHKIDHLDDHVASMVSSLTGLSRLNSGEETFLLVTAALANLTFMSPLAAGAMRQCKTAQALVNVVRSSLKTVTLFSKDQVVTVLANLAANANIRHDIQNLDGVGFLLAMLETKIENHFREAELAAAERVQKKSAIALSRLCNEPTVCRDLLRLGGIDRLVELCKNPSERNYSDAVLVACLAVLRRVKLNLEMTGNNEPTGHHDLSLVLRELDATDLVQPKLMESFAEYSNSKHSYV